MKNSILTIALLALSGSTYGMQQANTKEGFAIHTLFTQEQARQLPKEREKGLKIVRRLVKKHETNTQQPITKQTF